MAKNFNKCTSRNCPWPQIFNIFINDNLLFIETTTLCSYAGDYAMFSSDKNTYVVINRLRYDFGIISKWVYENFMFTNQDKCHFLTLGFNEPFPRLPKKNILGSLLIIS